MKPLGALKWGFPILMVVAAAGSWNCTNPAASPSAPVTVTQVVTPTPVPGIGSVWHLALADTASPASNQFTERLLSEPVSYNGYIWLVGGVNASSANFNDVWKSPDGVAWTRVLTDTASPGSNQFSRRHGHTVLSYNGALWVIGGFDGSNQFNDVWTSTDGASWTNVLVDSGSPPSDQFSRRELHSSAVFNGKMWVMGGHAGSAETNDVWNSSDGIHWTKLLADNASPLPGQFTERYLHHSAVFNGNLWVVAGGNTSGPSNFNDVWSSIDGIHWNNLLADNASPSSSQFPQRGLFSLTAFNGAMWVIGGQGTSAILGDVWNSTDGIHWNEVAATAAFGARGGQGALVFNNALWVIGGSNGSALNDTWYTP